MSHKKNVRIGSNTLIYVLGILLSVGLTAIGLFIKFKPHFTSAQTTQPNIVVIITDDQNVDSLPVMRNLMSYPEGSWVKFNNAFTNDSVCCPARSTILSGQYSTVTGVLDNNYGDKFNDTNTLPVWLHNAGYRTGLVGKYLNNYPWTKGAGYIPPGWDYFRESSAGGNTIGNADKHSDLAVNFINTSTTPFFLYLAYHDPHQSAKPLARYANTSVFVPPDPPNFNEADVSDKPVWIRSLPLLSQSAITSWHKERLASQRALLGPDDGIQRVIDALKAKGQLDNTMIIFLGDHGFSWGSHRYVLKHCGYEECIRFPMVIRYPGLGTNREENRLVSNVDLASTMAEYANVTPGLPQNGKSLIPVITNTATSWNEAVFTVVRTQGKRKFYGVRVPGWKYLEYDNADKELYDLTADPYEMQNRANQPSYSAKQTELAQLMHTMRGF